MVQRKRVEGGGIYLRKKETEYFAYQINKDFRQTRGCQGDNERENMLVVTVRLGIISL